MNHSCNRYGSNAFLCSTDRYRMNNQIIQETIGSDSAKLISSTLQVARDTAAAIAHQGECIQASSEYLSVAKYYSEKAKRTIRNMTWIGWLYNLVTPEPMICVDIPSSIYIDTNTIEQVHDLAELKKIAVDIGQALDQQNNQLDIILRQVDELDTSLCIATIHAGRMM